MTSAPGIEGIEYESVDLARFGASYLDQPALLERIRATCSQVYAARSSFPTNIYAALPPGALVQNLYGILQRQLGSFIKFNVSKEQIRLALNLLLQLDDIATIGHGVLIPREARVIRFLKSWGRIGGGLPLSFSKHSEEHLSPVNTRSLGRVVHLDLQDESPLDQWEVSEVYHWVYSSDTEILASLNVNCAGNECPSHERECVFYDHGLRPSRGNSGRWRAKLPGKAAFLAKTNFFPTNYYLVIRGTGRKLSWRELNLEYARKWLLIFDRIGGIQNFIQFGDSLDCVTFSLPNTLPRRFLAALFASCSQVSRHGGGWHCIVPSNLAHYARTLLTKFNFKVQ